MTLGNAGEPVNFVVMQSSQSHQRLKAALRRSAKLIRHRQESERTAARPPQKPRSRPRSAPAAGQSSLRPWMAIAASGICLGLCASTVVLWSLQALLPGGQYYERIQIPLARRWGLVEREALGWVAYGEALVKVEREAEALQAYSTAVGILDTKAEPSAHDLQMQVQAQFEALSRVKGSAPPMVHPPWGNALLSVLSRPFAPTVWLDAFVALPLIAEPQLALLLVLSLWLALNFVRSLQDQMSWTRILDQERPLSPGRVLPPLLGAALLAVLLSALLTLSPSQPVMAAVVCGAAVPGLFVQILNRVYQLRTRQALVAWESQHRAEFSSELHNTAQQSIMSAQGVLRQIIDDLEISEDPEAGSYAWRLAEAMERCQEVEDELRVLRNGTEDKFARGQTFIDAIEPIFDRLDRRGVQYQFLWMCDSVPVEAKDWEPWAFQLADSVQDRRIAATLYQVLSELSWNVLKYACRDKEEVHVDVTFNCSRQDRLVRYSLEVKDNGPGFDVQSAQDRRPHSGIFSLERYLKRVEMVGAEARSVLQTAPGQGTRVLTEIAAPTQRK